MSVDFAIIGAGPAGMAAAVLAVEFGLDTLLIDEQERPGGQIYRAIERAETDPSVSSSLGADYLAGRSLATALHASGAEYRPATTVWHIDPDGTLSLASDSAVDTVTARRILLATGAIERPVPIPGWTLPGVMTVGAAQILLKTADLVPDGRAVLAGQGPLLYLVALGFGLGPVFQKAGQGNYVQFVAPGIISMTILFSSVFSGMGLLWDRQFGFLKETLVAPVPRIYVMLGKTLGAAISVPAMMRAPAAFILPTISSERFTISSRKAKSGSE